MPPRPPMGRGACPPPPPPGMEGAFPPPPGAFPPPPMQNIVPVRYLSNEECKALMKQEAHNRWKLERDIANGVMPEPPALPDVLPFGSYVLFEKVK